MKYHAEAELKSGERLTLRSLTREDAPQALWIMHQCMGETLFMARYPDEVRMTAEQEAAFIENANAEENGVMLGAFIGEELIGLCNARPVAPNERYRHRAEMGVMIAGKHWGKGAGGAMMRALIDAMLKTDVEMIGLDVVSTNERAIALYQKFGFERYGLLERGMKYRDGSYADIVLMKLDLSALR